MLNARGDQKPATVRELLHETVSTLYELTAALPTDEPLRASLRHEALEAVRYAEHAALEPKDVVLFAASLGTLIAYCRLAALQYGPEFDAAASVLVSIRDVLGKRAQAQASVRREAAPAAPKKKRGAASAPTRRRRNRNQTNKTSQRQQALLTFLLEHPAVQIIELSKHFPGVSNRTLRRDLEALAKEGLVRREGTTSNAVYRVKADSPR